MFQNLTKTNILKHFRTFLLNMIKLDIKDQKLLYELSINSRQPLSVLSKKVNLSRDFVNYRISRLVKTKIVKQFYSEIDVESLGFSRSTVYLSFSKADKEKQGEMIAYLASNSFVTWFVTAVGKWNLIFDLITQNSKQLYSIIEKIKENYGEIISEYKLASLGEYYFFNEKPFGLASEQKTETSNIKIDSIDLEILSVICQNSRLTNIEIGKQLNLSPETVRKRISSLANSKIIKRFTISVDLSKIELELYNIQLDFEKYDKKLEKRLLDHLKQHPKITFIYKPLSNWDLEFGILVKNAYELNKELSELKNIFFELIKIHDSILLIDEIVPNTLPKGVLELIPAKIN